MSQKIPRIKGIITSKYMNFSFKESYGCTRNVYRMSQNYSSKIKLHHPIVRRRKKSCKHKCFPYEVQDCLWSKKAFFLTKFITIN